MVKNYNKIFYIATKLQNPVITITQKANFEQCEALALEMTKLSFRRPVLRSLRLWPWTGTPARNRHGRKAMPVLLAAG